MTREADAQAQAQEPGDDMTNRGIAGKPRPNWRGGVARPGPGRTTRCSGVARILGLASVVWAASTLVPSAEQDAGGLWEGMLDAGGTRLRLVLEVERGEDGTYSATLDSVDQGAHDLPVTTLTFEGGVLELQMTALGASYRGEERPDGSIEGTWSQGGVKLPLTFRRTETPPVLTRPQEPQPPFPYRVEKVEFANENAGDAGVRLAGTLTLPEGDGPHPGVVLISGSGQQDRDESIAGHRPFLVLADHLTRHGIAVLRYDDRGIGGSTGPVVTATSRDFAGDAAAALTYLRGRKEIDAGRAGLIGHSEGGIIAPMIAADSSDPAFLVLLAGPAVPGDEILIEQTGLIARAHGVPAQRIENNAAVQRKAFEIIAAEPKDDVAVQKLEALFRNELQQLSEAERKAIPDPEAHVQTQARQVVNPWFRFFLEYNPRDALHEVRVPVLALYGEKDLQVSSRQNLPEMARALAEGKCTDHTVATLPSLNHLFQTTGGTGSGAEYATIEETFAPRALTTITDWIRGRFQAPPPGNS